MKKCLALLLLFGIAPAWAAPNFDGGPFRGEVLESINAGTYTYLRLKTTDGEVWAAILLTNMPKGTKVQLHDPMLMTNFESRALGRTFNEIVFASAVSTDTTSAGSPSQLIAAAHLTAAKPSVNAPAEKVAKASGANAKSVAEIYAQRNQLNNKTVVVRGKVVKYSADIMDRNWIHLRDGTGSADTKSNDLLVTTKQTAKVGDVLLVRGPVKTDVNYGSGYAYSVVIDSATLQK